MPFSNTGRTVLHDPEFDETYADLATPEYIGLTQIDEAGTEHIVLLSPAMIATLLPLMDSWTAKQLTPQPTTTAFPLRLNSLPHRAISNGKSVAVITN